MRCVGLLSWYDERPDWLREAIRSFAPILDGLVAIDGAYHTYPDAHPCSDDRQHRAIIRETRAHRIPLTMVVPQKTWPSEVAKRSALFATGETMATPDDWFVVIDADERLEIDGPPEPVTPPLHAKVIRAELEVTDADVADVEFVEPHPNAKTQRFPIPIFFRAIPGIRVHGNHYTYKLPDGRVLWGRNCKEQPLDMSDVAKVRHLTHYRPKQRKQAATAYYQDRDQNGLEAGRCDECGQPAVTEIPGNWELRGIADDGQAKLGSDWLSVCATCKPKVKQRNDATLRGYGLEPSMVQVTFERIAPRRKVAA